MRHRKQRAKLGRTSSHREAMISNMITSLFKHERVKTTVQKAKEARRFAEKAITYAKKNTLHSRRLAYNQIKDEEVLSKLFAVLGPRFADRNGGYTRIIRLGHRQGDGAEIAFLELVDRIAPSPEKEERKKRRKKAAKEEKGGEEAVAEAEEVAEAEVVGETEQEAETDVETDVEVEEEIEKPAPEAETAAEGPAEKTDEPSAKDTPAEGEKAQPESGPPQEKKKDEPETK